MPLEDILRFEIVFESINELYDEGSVIIQEGDIFFEVDKKELMKSKEVSMLGGVTILIKRLLKISVLSFQEECTVFTVVFFSYI